MKKNTKYLSTIIIVIISCMILLPSYSKSKLVTIKGTISSYGAEPFTYPGIKTTKGKEYLVVCSENTKQELLERQGRLIRFTGFIIDDKEELPPNALKDGVFKIETWEVVTKKVK